jgi:hypothetical protein
MKIEVSVVPSLMISELPVDYSLVTWQVRSIRVGTIRATSGMLRCPCREFKRCGRIAASAAASWALILRRGNTVIVRSPGYHSRAIDFSVCADTARTLACIFIGRDMG